MKKCDLHIHSVFSDSDDTVEEIFKIAKANELSCLAITDHDTVAGVVAARSYSKIHNIELIEAIELSAQHKNVEIHILGYFINADNAKLKTELTNIRELRRERLLHMAGKLNSLGLKVDTDELMRKIGDAIPTRLHLALYLIEKGEAHSLREVFKKYLSPNRPAYAARFKYSVKEAVELIKSCGGLAFLAHPHVIPDQSWIEEFVSAGIDGIELVYPSMSAAKSSVYRSMALERNLLQSGGSDAHGSYKEFTKVGGVTIPYDWIQEMKCRLSSRLSEDKPGLAHS